MSDTEDTDGGLVRGLESDYTSSEEDVERELPTFSDHSFNDEDIAANYDRLGVLVPPPPQTLSLEELRLQYPDAFSEVSESVLQAVLDELQLPFDLSPFQIFTVNALLNRVDVVGISPMGSGKTLVGFFNFNYLARALSALGLLLSISGPQWGGVGKTFCCVGGSPSPKRP